jgi:hypothetical protein
MQYRYNTVGISDMRHRVEVVRYLYMRDILSRHNVENMLHRYVGY